MKSVATLSEVKQFFGFNNAKEFKEEWTELTKEDQDEIKALVKQA